MKDQNLAAKSTFPPLLHLTYILQQVADKQLLQEVGVSLSQTRIMSGLSSNIPKSQRALALEQKQTEANVSRQLKVMKKTGLVTIEKNKKDGRQRDVKLTAKGHKLYAAAEDLLLANKQLKRLSAELENIDIS